MASTLTLDAMARGDDFRSVRQSFEITAAKTSCRQRSFPHKTRSYATDYAGLFYEWQG
jgi:hypothetical protein